MGRCEKVEPEAIVRASFFFEVTGVIYLCYVANCSKDSKGCDQAFRV